MCLGNKLGVLCFAGAVLPLRGRTSVAPAMTLSPLACVHPMGGSTLVKKPTRARNTDA